MLQENVRAWYMSEYPDDDMGKDIHEFLTFGQMLGAMLEGNEVYDVIGVVDSVIRERIFERLAELMQCHYDTVYNIWRDRRKYESDYMQIVIDNGSNCLRTVESE